MSNSPAVARPSQLVIAKGLIATTMRDKTGLEVVHVDFAAIGPGLATLLAGVACGAIGSSVWWIVIFAFIL